jgi:hypothetical protein
MPRSSHYWCPTIHSGLPFSVRLLQRRSRALSQSLRWVDERSLSPNWSHKPNPMATKGEHMKRKKDKVRGREMHVKKTKKDQDATLKRHIAAFWKKGA